MNNESEEFRFDEVVSNKFNVSVKKSTLKNIFNANPKGINKKDRGMATEETKKRGVYALFLDGILKKIGRAITGNGIFTRMSQYYRMKEKDGALKYITEENKDKIEVWYFNLESNRDCWAAEKYLQAKAYYAGEEMEWDNEVHQDS